MLDITPGITGEAQVAVSERNTAVAHGSGGVPVFATPAMVALMENAALTSLEKVLPPGFSTVGTSIAVTHIAASPVGMKVTAKSELVEVSGKRLEFRVQAVDDKGLIGEGSHQRYIIEVEKFMSKAIEKIK